MAAGLVDTGRNHDQGLMTQAARLYFDRQMSKVEIAANLGISRFRVARLISDALDSGLVRIEYRDAPSTDLASAAEIESRFDLDLCVVATTSDDLDALGRLGASIIDGLVAPGEVVGIAWGSTLAAVTAAIPTRRDPAMSVVQLAGSSIGFGRDQDPSELARVLADRWGASHHPLFVPAYVDRPAVRDALLRQTDVAATAALFGRLTTAIIGIGALGQTTEHSSLTRYGALDADTVRTLARRGVVGDLLLHPLTESGAFPATDLARRAMSITVDGLRAVPRVVAVAAGADKAAAIRGALRSGIVRVLVTDPETVQAVLDGPRR
jgi:DNA-binding transcriptional regulator LsrR (DeoR family)